MPSKRLVPVKHCLDCGTQLQRKRFNGRLEDASVFSRRKYCGRFCMAQAKTMENPSLSAYRKRAAKFRGESCEFCGTSSGLHIHHKNENVADNSPGNLQTLCGSCHLKDHHKRWNRKKPKPPCMVCGRVSYRSKLCNTCRTRQRKNGTPYLKAERHGSRWVLVSIR